MSLRRRLSAISLWTLVVACALAACSDEDGPTDTTNPPELDIVELFANDGTRLVSHPPGGTLPAPCDGRLVVRVASGDVPSRLDDWELRPPGTCGTSTNCGFVFARVLDADGVELATGSVATVDVPVPTAELDLNETYRLTAELRQGRTGEVFTVRDEASGERVPVRAETTFTLEAATCPSQEPGMGGAGGGGAPPSGGAGGLGGAAG